MRKPINNNVRYRGVLAITADDGNETAYTQMWNFYRDFKEKQRSRFFPFKDELSFTSTVNAATIGQAGKHTVEQMIALQDEGGEISNHGRTHASLRISTLGADYTAGDTTLVMAGTNSMMNTAASDSQVVYQISDGVNTDTFYTTSVVVETDVDGNDNLRYTLNAALNNSYAMSNSETKMTAAALQTEINDAKATLEGWGLNIHSFVNGKHHTSPDSLAVIAEQHESARNRNYTVPNTIPLNTYRLGALTALDADTVAEREAYLDKVSAENGFGILFNHGSGGSITESYITAAIERNIRVVSRHRAFQIMQNKLHV